MPQHAGRLPQTSSPVTISGRPRKRAVEACAFCRKRKIKCNNEQPTCANCKIYDKVCVYVPLSPQHGADDNDKRARTNAARTTSPSAQARRHRLSRPTRATRSGPSVRRTLQSDNGHHASSRRSSHRRSPAFTEEPEEADASRAPRDSPADENHDHGRQPDQPSSSRVVVSSNGTSSYHGHTSTLYEEQGSGSGGGGGGEAAARSKIPDDWIGKGLVAEAARQRQLEELNLHTGRLDFDGVDADLGMHLLNLHWNRQHHSFNVTYRPAFMRDMACGGPYFSKLLLNALYFGASKFSPRLEVRRDPADVRTAGWKYRERVRKLLGSALDRSDITTIQALLIMSNSLFALGDERSAAWLYAGLAFRMIVDLGMHVDGEGLRRAHRLTDEDVEIRRRVFWAAFIVDKIQSLYQGRPVTLKESDTLVPIKFLDTYEEFEFWRPMAFSLQSVEYPGTPAYSVSTFTALCRLSVVMSDVLSGVYAERTFDKTPSELSRLLESLDGKLKAWKSSLPPHLTIDAKNVLKPTPPHVFSLNALYNVLCILLHRPFVADGHLYGTLRDISVKSFITCASAADNIVTLLRAYDRAFAIARAPYLISYACYVAATIHVRIAAKRGANSEARSSLATCLAVFNRNQETNVAIRRAQHIIQGLMKRLGVPEPRPEIILDWNGKADLAARGMSGPFLHQPSETIRDTRHQSSSNAYNEDVSELRLPDPPPQSRGEYPDAVVENVASPVVRWSDIDGIIQSFVRAPEILPQQGVDSGYQLPSNAVEGYDANGLPFGRLPPSNTIRYQPEPSFEQDYGIPTKDREMPWPGAMTYDSLSFDDLLFGLNGSALDSFRYYE